MSELSQADRFLLDAVRAGDGDAWSQLVDRYQGRLVAFARSRLPGSADPEDLVQETFLGFLKGLGSFRGDAAIETYLFAILRNRIADWYRPKRLSVCLLQDARGGEGADEPIRRLRAPDPSASYYMRRGEQDDMQRRALAGAVRGLVNGYKQSLNFRDLKIIEMLFYCQLPNSQVARLIGMDQKQVGLIKHRSLKKVRQAVRGELGSAADGEAPARDESMLTDVWENGRLSCPKRSTIGAYLLRTLDAPWQDYVDFHLHTLGCRFCLANLEDLRHQTSRDAAPLRDRILQSTVGFLRRPGRHSAP